MSSSGADAVGDSQLHAASTLPLRGPGTSEGEQERIMGSLPAEGVTNSQAVAIETGEPVITPTREPGQKWVPGIEGGGKNHISGAYQVPDAEGLAQLCMPDSEQPAENRVPGTRSQTKQLKDKLRKKIKFTLHPCSSIRNKLFYPEQDVAFTLNTKNTFFLDLCKLKQICGQSYVSLLDEVITGSSLCYSERLERRLASTCSEVNQKYKELNRTKGPSSRKAWLARKKQLYLLKSEVKLGSSLPIVTQSVVPVDFIPAPHFVSQSAN